MTIARWVMAQRIWLGVLKVHCCFALGEEATARLCNSYVIVGQIVKLFINCRQTILSTCLDRLLHINWMQQHGIV